MVRIEPGAPPRALAWRLAPSRRALGAFLGARAGADPDRLDHLAERVLRHLGEAVARGTLPAPPLAASAMAMLLPQPQAGPALAPPPGNGMAIALLPLTALADPGRLADRRARLEELGWAGSGLLGLDAGVLGLVAPEALPRDGPLLVRWSPALADRGVALAALRALDPARLILTGCGADGEAILWGLGMGVRHFAGPGAEALCHDTVPAPAGPKGRALP